VHERLAAGECGVQGANAAECVGERLQDVAFLAAVDLVVYKGRVVAAALEHHLGVAAEDFNEIGIGFWS